MKAFSAVFWTTFITACGSSESQPTVDLGIADASVFDAGPDAGSINYPAGPYGTQEQDILPNLSFSGFLVTETASAADQPFAEVRLSDLRTQGRYLLLNGSTTWCAPCRDEAIAFRAGADRWRAAGGVVLSILVENLSLSPASRSDLDRWVDEFAVNYTMVHDPRGQVDAEFAPPSYPLNLLVDLETMRVVRRRDGLDDDLFEAWEALLAP